MISKFIKIPVNGSLLGVLGVFFLSTASVGGCGAREVTVCPEPYLSRYATISKEFEAFSKINQTPPETQFERLGRLETATELRGKAYTLYQDFPVNYCALSEGEPEQAMWSQIYSMFTELSNAKTALE